MGLEHAACAHVTVRAADERQLRKPPGASSTALNRFHTLYTKEIDCAPRFRPHRITLQDHGAALITSEARAADIPSALDLPTPSTNKHGHTLIFFNEQVRCALQCPPRCKLAESLDALGECDDFGYMPRGTNGALRHGILYKAK